MITIFMHLFYALSVLLSIALLIYSIINKDIKNNKYILIVDFAYIAYSLAFYIPRTELPLHIGLDVIFDMLFTAIICAVNLISAIICLVKKAKKKVSVTPKSKHSKKVLVVLLLLPAVIFSFLMAREIYLVKQSDLLLVCHSAGNGWFSGSDFCYAVNDRYCKEVETSIGYAYHGTYPSLGRIYLPSGIKPIKIISNKGRIYELEQIEGRRFTVVIEERSEDTLQVYIDGKKIHHVVLKDGIWNISLKEAFYAG